MTTITADSKLVAYCGLYCGACGRYLNEKCPGCAQNEKAGWCQIRACNIENGYTSCADCTQFADVNDCKKFNNLVSRMFAFVFRSNRPACIVRIREIGVESYAAEMAQKGQMTIKR